MKFEVNTATLNDTVKEMERELNNIRNIHKQLEGAVSALHGMWVGEAHTIFEKQFQIDQNILSAMCQTLDTIIDGIDNARDKYDRCEQSVKSEISKISI